MKNVGCGMGSGIFQPAGDMNFNAFVVAAVAVGASQGVSIARSAAMFFREQKIGQPFLMKITELEGYIAKLNGAVGADPQQAVAVAWDLHLGAFDQPVWNRAQRHQRLL